MSKRWAGVLIGVGLVVPPGLLLGVDPEEAIEQGQRQLEQVKAQAILKGYATQGVSPEGRHWSITGLQDGMFVYEQTDNTNAAISTNAHRVRDNLALGVDGATSTVGVWDGGNIRDTHVEFGNRVTFGEVVSLSSHATHVGGTIGASGVNSQAQGMAPMVNLLSYDFSNDEPEMTLEAAVSPVGGINISNHSYGFISGWANGSYSGNSGPHFFGLWDDMDIPQESHYFGIYDTTAALWDQIVFDSTYYLPLKSSGNDRNDNAPSNGTTFYRFEGAGWAAEVYDDLTHPPADGGATGYDTVSANGNAKNILTVGAINDAVSGGVRSLPNGTMSTFSGWGPTDDGRIKPDVVGNGVSLISSTSTTDSSYGSSSGTSMSTPNVTGSATLLQEYYRNYTGGGMPASLTKALLIHTADDLGNPGPDYSFGWGLVNTLEAMHQLRADELHPAMAFITYADLADQGNFTVDVTAAGDIPLKATLVWTDPPGTATEPAEIDNPAIKLINDLDLTIQPVVRGAVSMPWVLDPANPANNATTGDNIRDNVEQVLIENPVADATYTVSVSHKGALLDLNPQAFSLIISGMPVVLFEDGFD